MLCRAKITASFVNSVEAPTDRRQQIYSDTELPGFRLVVGRSAKTYAVVFRVDGQKGFQRLGRHGELTVAQARKAAQRILARVHLDEHTPKKSRVTLRQAWERKKQDMVAQKRSEATIADYMKRLDIYFGDWLDRPIEAVGKDRDGVRARFNAILAKQADFKARKGKGLRELSSSSRARPLQPARGGEESAHGAMRVLRTVYAHARTIDPRLPANPVEVVKLKQSKKRNAALTDDQLRGWYQAIQRLRPNRRDYYKLLLFSGLRSGSAAAIRWDDISFLERKLRIPRPKGGEERAYDVPLSDVLMDIFEERRNHQEKAQSTNAARVPRAGLNYDYVFPAFSTTGHLATARKDDAAGIAMPHALRHTYNTTGIRAGVSDYYIKALLNHALPTDDMTGRYFTPSFDDLLLAQQRISDRLAEILAGSDRPR